MFTPGRLRTARRSRPLPGETECGDQIYVAERAGLLEVAVVDGLGHGPEAAAAAKAICAFLERESWTSLTQMLRLCDRVARGTRGAAMTLVRIRTDSGRLEHAGVGNVETVAVTRRPIRPITTPGIVGGGITRILESAYDLSDGDLVVIHSDGVSRRFDLQKYKGQDPGEIALSLSTAWAKESDDAACFVITC